MAYLILLVSLFFSHQETAFLKAYSKSISKLHGVANHCRSQPALEDPNVPKSP
jgi:hypothetical protein